MIFTSTRLKIRSMEWIFRRRENEMIKYEYFENQIMIYCEYEYQWNYEEKRNYDERNMNETMITKMEWNKKFKTQKIWWHKNFKMNWKYPRKWHPREMTKNWNLTLWKEIEMWNVKRKS